MTKRTYAERSECTRYYYLSTYFMRIWLVHAASVVLRYMHDISVPWLKLDRLAGQTNWSTLLPHNWSWNWCLFVLNNSLSLMNKDDMDFGGENVSMHSFFHVLPAWSSSIPTFSPEIALLSWEIYSVLLSLSSGIHLVAALAHLKNGQHNRRSL